MLPNKYKNIIVTNCDVIFKINLNNYLKFHNENKNDITIVVSERKFSLPYGVCNIKNNTLENIIEKPKYKFPINAGMYILKNTTTKLIKKNQKLDFDQLIKKAKK